jgi:hypothetical protein
VIILDTNVVSALMLAVPDARVVEWLDGQAAESIWLTSITTFEIGYGIALLPRGKRRSALEEAFAASLATDFGERVLPFDEDAARHAVLAATRARREGSHIDIRDVQIAGIAMARRAVVATRNRKHFEAFGVKLVDPWES